MIKYSYIKLTGCLVAAALAPLCTSAQRINTEASVERLKSESLQFSYSDNASGIQLDQMDYYSQVGLGYDIEKGSFKRAQEGEHNTGYRFFTDGGGTMKALKGAFIWGSFEYSRDQLRDAEYNASLIDPLRGTPFFIADTYKSKWINQLYDMTVKAAAPKLWDRLIFGIEATYQNGQGAKQHDPRPLVSLSKFEIKPGVTVTLGKHAIGANYQYYSRREDGTASNKISMSTNPVYIFNFPGFYVDASISSSTDDNQRIYNANCMGVGGQYSFTTQKLRLLVSGKYTREIEDVTNSYTTPKMVGTTRDERWSIGLNAVYKPSKENTFFLNAAYGDRSIDGIQYVQEWDNSFEVAKWIIKSKSVRSNSSKAGFEGRLQYMRTTRGDSYNWTAGVEFSTEKLSDIYYFPRSTQDIENCKIGIFGRKNFIFNEKHSLLVGIRASYKMNNSSDIDYNGYKADTKCPARRLRRRNADPLRGAARQRTGLHLYPRLVSVRRRAEPPFRGYPARLLQRRERTRIVGPSQLCGTSQDGDAADSLRFDADGVGGGDQTDRIGVWPYRGFLLLLSSVRIVNSGISQ